MAVAGDMRQPEGSAMPRDESVIDSSDSRLLELLTVDDVAALLKVSKSWVYEHTRSRSAPRTERLPHVKIGKYVRFDPRLVRAFIDRAQRHAMTRIRSRRYNGRRATARRVSERKGMLSMTRSKRQYGSGCLLKRRKGWAIRWREIEIAPDGTRKKVLRYEALGDVTRKIASDTLAQKLVSRRRTAQTPMRSRVTFRTLAGEWEASVMPMYKHSTQNHRRFMLKKHLLPRFGDLAISDVTRQEIQAYVAHLHRAGYAPRTIDHIHDVLSAILRTAMKWGHLRENPARGVDLPKLKCVRPKWALTTAQAAQLLAALPMLPRTMVGLAILSGLRRGELFALRWRDIDEQARLLTVREAVYDGVFSTPKTEAGARQIPLSDTALTLIAEWKAARRRTSSQTR